jgi:propionyl-CoA carboxylase alpha chain
VLLVAGVERRVRTSGADSPSGEIDVDGDGWSVALRALPRFPDPVAAVAAGSLLAPMPGAVVAVHVTTGQTVEAGAPLLVLEAMKMQHPVVAPAAGVVRSLDVAVGTQVDAGTVLAVIDPTEET